MQPGGEYTLAGVMRADGAVNRAAYYIEGGDGALEVGGAGAPVTASASDGGAGRRKKAKVSTSSSNKSTRVRRS